MDPGAVTSTEPRTAIEIAADEECKDAFKILAPLMEGTEALKKSQEVMETRTNLRELIDQIDSEPADSPSQEFRDKLSLVPLEQVRQKMVLVLVSPCPTFIICKE